MARQIAIVLMVLCSEAAADWVEIPCTLQVGQVVELQFTRSRRTSEPAKEVPAMEMNTLTRFEVLEQNDTGFVLEWRTDWESSLRGLEKMDLQLDIGWLEESIERLSEHRLLIQTDDLATPLELVNLEETSSLIRTFVRGMIESMELEEEDREIVENLLGQMLSPELIISRTLEDASLYFMFTGASLELGESYAAEELLANPLGGDPFPAEVLFSLISADRDTGTARVDYSQTTDESAVRSFMKSLFAQVPDGDEVLAEMQDAEMGIFAEASFEMNLVTGLANRVEFERSIQMGPAQRVDGIVIETLSNSAAPAEDSE